MAISKIHIYKYTLFLSHVVEIKLNFRSMGIGQTWPLAKFSHTLFFYPRGLKLAVGEIFTYALFLPQGVEIYLFSLYGGNVPRYVPIFKITLFGHRTWQSALQKLQIHSISTPGVEIELLFLLYWQRFPRYGLPYLGMNLVTDKGSRSCIYTLFLPHGCRN